MKIIQTVKTADGVPLSEVDGAVFFIRDQVVVKYEVSEIIIRGDSAEKVTVRGYNQTYGSFNAPACTCYASEAAAWQKIIAIAQEASNGIVARAAARIAQIGGGA